MSYLVKGMEMPIVCEGERERCRFADFYFGDKTCYLTGDYIEKGKLNENCPLVPVPPHGRLGDLDRLEQMFADIDHAPYSGFDGIEPFYSAEDAAQIIRLAPTVIEAEEGET